MSLTLILIIVAIIVALALLVLTLSFFWGSSDTANQQAVSSNLRNLVLAQRNDRATAQRAGKSAVRSKDDNLAFVAAAEGDMSKKEQNSSRMTLQKRLMYAKWIITPVQFRLIQVFLAIGLAVPAYFYSSVWIVCLALFIGPFQASDRLDSAVRKRFEAFDADYPVLLLSFVSLLKTGMSAIQGLESAAGGLDADSMVRYEVELLIERLRLGMTEEQAIGAFGEDVAHPELELFVQSLILSKRVGGTLSTTLERLAKQVRKRQQFRKMAVAAVGMERSSIKMIAVIMGLLMCYLTFTAPDLVLPAFKHPLGYKVFTFGIMTIFLGFAWSRKVTDIKI